jgi:hypothetical protein
VNEFDLKEVAKSWIRMHNAEINSDEYEEEFWSFEKLDGLCRKSPNEAWALIVEIYENHAGEKIESNLAAGPLEDLLVNHGRQILKLIDGYCENSSGFVGVLKMVWQNSMPDDVWGELQKLIARRS